jgi:hypothetical protein
VQISSQALYGYQNLSKGGFLLHHWPLGRTHKPIGDFIKMGRFDKTLEGFRKDYVSHEKTCADV